MFHSFCSTVFVSQFLFCYFCSAIFCSAIFVLLTFLHLHLGSPSPNSQESPPIFVPQFLFCYFCSAGAFLHLNPVYHITWQMLPLQSPNIKWTKSVKHPLLYPFNFCSAIFVPQFLFRYFGSAIFCSAIFVLLTFLHLHLGSPSPNGQESPPIFVPQFLFRWPFCTCTWGPRHPMAKSPHQFLFYLIDVTPSKSKH